MTSLAFSFLASLPVRPKAPRAARRRPKAPAARGERAFRPHLRGRTPTALQRSQLVLPLRSPPGASRYKGIEAVAMEDAVRSARAGNATGVEQLVALTRPELLEVARAVGGPRCPLPVEELAAVAEARLVELQAWQRFEPGRARGRTLWPAFARKVARQAMGAALEKEGPVHVTRWARRRKAVLEARAEAEGRTPEEVLAESPEGGAAAAVLELPHAATLEAARHVAAESTSREERSHEALAVIHLARLPVRERVAVAGPLGLLKEGVVKDSRLAKHLRTTVEGVERLREAGLRRLRAAMGEA